MMSPAKDTPHFPRLDDSNGMSSSDSMWDDSPPSDLKEYWKLQQSDVPDEIGDQDAVHLYEEFESCQEIATLNLDCSPHLKPATVSILTNEIYLAEKSASPVVPLSVIPSLIIDTKNVEDIMCLEKLDIKLEASIEKAINVEDLVQDDNEQLTQKSIELFSQEADCIVSECDKVPDEQDVEYVESAHLQNVQCTAPEDAVVPDLRLTPMPDSYYTGETIFFKADIYLSKPEISQHEPVTQLKTVEAFIGAIEPEVFQTETTTQSETDKSSIGITEPEVFDIIEPEVFQTEPQTQSETGKSSFGITEPEVFDIIEPEVFQTETTTQSETDKSSFGITEPEVFQTEPQAQSETDKSSFGITEPEVFDIIEPEVFQTETTTQYKMDEVPIGITEPEVFRTEPPTQCKNAEAPNDVIEPEVFQTEPPTWYKTDEVPIGITEPEAFQTEPPIQYKTDKVPIGTNKPEVFQTSPETQSNYVEVLPNNKTKPQTQSNNVEVLPNNKTRPQTQSTSVEVLHIDITKAPTKLNDIDVVDGVTETEITQIKPVTQSNNVEAPILLSSNTKPETCHTALPAHLQTKPQLLNVAHKNANNLSGQSFVSKHHVSFKQPAHLISQYEQIEISTDVKSRSTNGKDCHNLSVPSHICNTISGKDYHTEDEEKFTKSIKPSSPEIFFSDDDCDSDELTLHIDEQPESTLLEAPFSNLSKWENEDLIQNGKKDTCVSYTTGSISLAEPGNFSQESSQGLILSPTTGYFHLAEQIKTAISSEVASSSQDKNFKNDFAYEQSQECIKKNSIALSLVHEDVHLDDIFCTPTKYVTHSEPTSVRKSPSSENYTNRFKVNSLIEENLESSQNSQRSLSADVSKVGSPRLCCVNEGDSEDEDLLEYIGLTFDKCVAELMANPGIPLPSDIPEVSNHHLCQPNKDNIPSCILETDAALDRSYYQSNENYQSTLSNVLSDSVNHLSNMERCDQPLIENDVVCETNEVLQILQLPCSNMASMMHNMLRANSESQCEVLPQPQYDDSVLAKTEELETPELSLPCDVLEFQEPALFQNINKDEIHPLLECIVNASPEIYQSQIVESFDVNVQTPSEVKSCQLFQIVQPTMKIVNGSEIQKSDAFVQTNVSGPSEAPWASYGEYNMFGQRNRGEVFKTLKRSLQALNLDAPRLKKPKIVSMSNMGLTQELNFAEDFHGFINYGGESMQNANMEMCCSSESITDNIMQNKVVEVAPSVDSMELVEESNFKETKVSYSSEECPGNTVSLASQVLQSFQQTQSGEASQPRLGHKDTTRPQGVMDQKSAFNWYKPLYSTQTQVSDSEEEVAIQPRPRPLRLGLSRRAKPKSNLHKLP